MQVLIDLNQIIINDKISSLLAVNDVSASLPPSASTLPRKPYARDRLYFYQGLSDGNPGSIKVYQI